MGEFWNRLKKYWKDNVNKSFKEISSKIGWFIMTVNTASVELFFTVSSLLHPRLESFANIVYISWVALSNYFLFKAMKNGNGNSNGN